MNDILRWTVADIMQEDVLTVAPDVTVAKLLELLEEHDVSGLPVVGADDDVQGVVSVSDVARAAGEEAASGRPPSRRGRDPSRDPLSTFFRLPDGPATGLPSSLPRSKLGARAVRDIMTPATFSVRPEATLAELARFLVQGGVHRALVLDGSTLAGIVTSMDVVRAVGRAEVPA